MMNVLDLLNYRLSAQGRSFADIDPAVREMIQGSSPGFQTPPGVSPSLPLVVQDSIGNRPSYGEGEIMAPSQWWNPAVGGQLKMSGPQREEHLSFDLSDTRDKGNWPVMREGEYASRRPPEFSPFADPLNQLLTRLGQRAPLALY